MIFVGDIALPYTKAIDFKAVPEYLKTKSWFGNLEGSIIEANEEMLANKVVFNDLRAVKEMTSEFDFVGFALANNHLSDVQEIQPTLDELKKMNVPFVGAGRDFEGASKPLLINDDGRKLCILNFGWSVIHCQPAGTNREGINPYEKAHVLNSVRKALECYPDAGIIVYFHWNYELELYPQPADRELAVNLIDMGVLAVLGAHSHRVQPIEFHKGKPIVYGLGNWIFPQNIFFNRKLKYPAFCCRQIAFEINAADDFMLHEFQYIPDEQIIKYTSSKSIDEYYNDNIAFSELNKAQYIRWFKSNRYQKKLLPVFKYDDNVFILKIKKLWVKTIRHAILLLLKKLIRGK